MSYSSIRLPCRVLGSLSNGYYNKKGLNVEQIEQWRGIKGFPYEVSSLGRVRRSAITSKYSNATVGKILKPWITGNSCYLAVTLFEDGKRYDPTVHKLVMEAFVGPRPYKKDIHHMNGDRQDNRLVNLGYVTRSWNMRAMKDSPGPKPKLSGKEIQLIRFLSKNTSGKMLAKRFNCSPATISNVINNKY